MFPKKGGGRRAVASMVVLLGLLSPVAAGAEPAAQPHRPRPLEIVDLGALPGATQSWALSVNNRGWVVGVSYLPDVGTRATLWRDGQIIDLGSLAGPDGGSDATAINDRGEIVGGSFTPDGGYRPFLWKNGRMTDLGALGGAGFGRALDINERGEVVGIVSTDDPLDVQGFVWRNGRVTALAPAPGQTSSIPAAINDRGDVVGRSGGAVLWRNGRSTPEPLGLPPGAAAAQATDINDRGDITGVTQLASGALDRAIVWRRGVPVDLGLANGSVAQAINDRGRVVGVRPVTPSGTGGAFVWDRGVARDLPSLVPGYPADAASDVNDHGVIVGTSATEVPHPDDPEYERHAVLWK